VSGKTFWDVLRGSGPLIATAIHDGHALRPEIARLMAVPEALRGREEDPFTAQWTSIAKTRIVPIYSRFQVDLNRPRELCVYRNRDQAFGLEVWKEPLPDDVIRRSYQEYDAFYAMLRAECDFKRDSVGPFVVLDLHSYNHLPDGSDRAAADPARNPQINVGTGSMPPDRARRRLVERLIEALRRCTFHGEPLDVRENVRFRGGWMSQWVHQNYGEHGTALAIEVKKFFMDEWTGQPDRSALAEVEIALGVGARAVEEALYQ
jgi:N-formylglutamate amidohydrolase